MNRTKHPLWNRWRYWVSTTTNPRSAGYPYNGGRGICIKFRNFEHMIEYVESRLGLPPNGTASRLRRINVNGHFAPGNLCWATGSEVVGNNTRSKKYRYKGKSQCLSHWAKEVGICKATLYSRVNDLGWTIKQAIETPLSR